MPAFKLPVFGFALLGLIAAQEDAWDLAKQKAAVQGWEKRWAVVEMILTRPEDDAKDMGLDSWADLRMEIVRDRGKITDEEVLGRLEDLEGAMKSRYTPIKWALLERLARRAHKILAVMEGAYRERQYVDVLRMYEEDLEPLADLMGVVDKDFVQVAEDALEKGKVLREDGEVGIEFHTLGLEVASIHIPEDKTEARSMVLLHRKEKPPVEAPHWWKPSGRRYVAGDLIHQLPSVRIRAIHSNRVAFVYKEKYVIDLLLRVEHAAWNAGRQEAAVEEWEKECEEVLDLIWREDEVQRDGGLDRYIELRFELGRDQGKITDDSLKKRMRDVSQALFRDYDTLKWVLLERLAIRGQYLLLRMDRTYRGKKYEEVLRLHDEDLKSLVERMTAMDRDFVQVAGDVLEKGKSIRKDAQTGLEIRCLDLVVVRVNMPGREGGEPSVIILNRKESPPEGEPEGRRYVEGDAIYQLPLLTVRTIGADRVECVYRQRYAVYLDGKAH